MNMRKTLGGAARLGLQCASEESQALLCLAAAESARSPSAAVLIAGTMGSAKSAGFDLWGYLPENYSMYDITCQIIHVVQPTPAKLADGMMSFQSKLLNLPVSVEKNVEYIWPRNRFFRSVS
jgi:hypothetical protein